MLYPHFQLIHCSIFCLQAYLSLPQLVAMTVPVPTLHRFYWCMKLQPPPLCLSIVISLILHSPDLFHQAVLALGGISYLGQCCPSIKWQSSETSRCPGEEWERVSSPAFLLPDLFFNASLEKNSLAFLNGCLRFSPPFRALYHSTFLVFKLQVEYRISAVLFCSLIWRARQK